MGCAGSSDLDAGAPVRFPAQKGPGPKQGVEKGCLMSSKYGLELLPEKPAKDSFTAALPGLIVPISVMAPACALVDIDLGSLAWKSMAPTPRCPRDKRPRLETVQAHIDKLDSFQVAVETDPGKFMKRISALRRRMVEGSAIRQNMRTRSDLASKPSPPWQSEDASVPESKPVNLKQRSWVIHRDTSCKGAFHVHHVNLQLAKEANDFDDDMHDVPPERSEGVPEEFADVPSEKTVSLPDVFAGGAMMVPQNTPD